MVFQNSVNQFLARGIEGEYSDDSPRRECGYILQGQTTDGVAAQGVITFTANPTANDSVTIANVTYTFKSTLAAANDIKIGANLEATIASLVKAINGTGTAGTDYYTGTANLAALLTADGSATVLTLTANEAGVEGNYIALASSAANGAVTAFAGGVTSSSVLPKFACAFTHTEVDGTAQIGGTGEFAGVLVNPKMYANYANLTPSLELPNGSQGGLCTFGHINVKPASAFAPGYVAAFSQATGAINAYVNAEAIPASFTQIANAKFIEVSGNANDLAVLQLGD